MNVESRPIRLGMLAGSPVPYKLPLYRRLEHDPRVDFTAIFSSSAGIRPHDDSFLRGITWDLDVRAGYRNVFLRGADRSPALGTSFWSVHDPDILRVLRRERFDVLWLEGYNSATHLMAAAGQLMLGSEIVFREEQTTLHPRSLLRTIFKEASLRTLFRNRYAMYISTENRRWFEHYGVAPDRLFSAPYSVDNDFFQAEAQRLRPLKPRLRREFGVEDDAGPVVLTVCRLVEKKQPLFLLEAFRRVRAVRRCSLVVAGAGPLEGAMRAEVESAGISDVHFAGFLNQGDVSRAYACADVFALLSRQNETFGVVVPEAMNFGLPLVLSDKVGCAADLVGRGFNGDVVAADDLDGAVEAIARIIDDEALRARMGQGSEELIQRWTPERTAEGVIGAALAAVR
jgi:glycosyltransferase involved in cell wall biosynthesis